MISERIAVIRGRILVVVGRIWVILVRLMILPWIFEMLGGVLVVFAESG